MKKYIYIFLTIYIISLSNEKAFSNSYNDLQDLNIDSMTINFKFDDYTIDKNYRMNNYQIQRMDSLLNSRIIEKVIISSYTSIEGDSRYNKNLSILRSDNLRSLINTINPNIRDNNIIIYSEGENWDGLLDQVYERKWIPYREELIDLLENKTISNKDKKDTIKKMHDGTVYNYLNQYVFWKQRNSSSIIFYHKKLTDKITSSIGPLEVKPIDIKIGRAHV